MLRVKIFLQKSEIHGIGVFATDIIPKGTITWVFDEGIDLILPISKVESLPEPAKSQLYHYGYIYLGTNNITLCADDARFMNHSGNSNTKNVNGSDIAVQDIAAGEEITCDYYDFDEDAFRKLGTSRDSKTCKT
jgi:SET domain-containing protein